MIKTYLELVKEARKSGGKKVLENSSPEHAKIIIKNLIESATDHKKNGPEEIKIVAGTFRQEVYDCELVQAAKNAMENGAIITAIATELEDSDIANSPFARIINTDKNGTLVCSKDVFEQVPHLVLVGNKKYRLEPNPEYVKAVASFNDESTARTIQSLFDKVYNLAGSHHERSASTQN